MECETAEPLQIIAGAPPQAFVTVKVRQQLAQTAQDIPPPKKILYPFMTSAKGDKGVSHGFTANFALRPRF